MLCITLASTTIAMGVWAATLSVKVATLTASAAATLVQHRKEMARAVMRAKAKGRVRQAAVALPVIGIAVVGAFETADYLEWKADNPDGDLNDYGCEMAAATAGVVDEVLASLPQSIRPPKDVIAGHMPACE
ncbi:MAG: hypothetical protein MUC58_14930 [Rhizobiaceae bacterium]|nr:hypothetical protein [Rhizobiaceae bacterium]